MLGLQFSKWFRNARPWTDFASYWIAGISVPNCLQVSLQHPSQLFQNVCPLSRMAASSWVTVCVCSASSRSPAAKSQALMWSASHFSSCVWWMLISRFRFPPNDFLFKVALIAYSLKTIPYKAHIWSVTCDPLQTIMFLHLMVSLPPPPRFLFH